MKGNNRPAIVFRSEGLVQALILDVCDNNANTVIHIRYK